MYELPDYSRFTALKMQLTNNQLALNEVTVKDFHQLIVCEETQEKALLVLGQEYLLQTLRILNDEVNSLEYDRDVFERMDKELDGIVYLDNNNEIRYNIVKIGTLFTNYLQSMVSLSDSGELKPNFGMILQNLLFFPKNAWIFGKNLGINKYIKGMRQKYIEGRGDNSPYCIPEHIDSGMEELLKILNDNNQCEQLADISMGEYLELTIGNVVGLTNIVNEYKIDSEVLRELFRSRNEIYYR